MRPIPDEIVSRNGITFRPNDPAPPRERIEDTRDTRDPERMEVEVDAALREIRAARNGSSEMTTAIFHFPPDGSGVDLLERQRRLAMEAQSK